MSCPTATARGSKCSAYARPTRYAPSSSSSARVDPADVVGLEDGRIEHGGMLVGPRRRFYTRSMERKLASVLFVDIVDSTRLVTGADPEVVRRRVTRFFEMVSRCVEQHGGIVEKFAGDAVMAAFGVPQAHEDDALRAARAALAMRAGGRRARARGAHRDRGGRGRRRRRGVDVRDRRGRESRRSAAGSRPSRRDPHRPDGVSARGGKPRGRGRRPARAQGHRRPSARLARRRHARRARHGRSGRARRSSAATPSSSCSRTRSTAAFATGGRTSSRSTARRASGRAGSRASSSTAWSARASSSAARCRTAKASRTGRSARW